MNNLKALLVANGGVNNEEFLRILSRDFDMVIGVDGGANFLKRANVKPDYIVGDMDSVDPSVLSFFEKNGVEILRYPREKDKTDTELAVDLLLNMNVDDITFSGVVGDRMDHTFAVFQILYKLKLKGIKSRIVEKDLDIFLLRNEIFVMSVRKGETWSILPIFEEARKVDLEGFLYPVKNFKFPFGKTVGVSNETVEDSVKIVVGEGSILVFRWKVRV